MPITFENEVTIVFTVTEVYPQYPGIHYNIHFERDGVKLQDTVEDDCSSMYIDGELSICKDTAQLITMVMELSDECGQTLLNGIGAITKKSVVGTVMRLDIQQLKIPDAELN